jgi:hypothetical protein
MGRGKWRGAARLPGPHIPVRREGNRVGTASRARAERPDRARAIQRFSRRNVSRADVMRRRNGIKQAVGHATRYSHAKQMCSGSVIAARILDLLRQRAIRRPSSVGPGTERAAQEAIEFIYEEVWSRFIFEQKLAII